MNQRHLTFIEHYLLRSNATEAALAAGYSEKAARVQGNRLLKNPTISKEIAARQLTIVSSNDVRIADLIADLVKISKADIRKLFNEDGTLKEINAIDENTAFAISEYSETIFKGQKTRKVKFHSRLTSIDMLLKIIGGYINEFTLMQKLDDAGLDDLAKRVLKLANEKQG